MTNLTAVSQYTADTYTTHSWSCDVRLIVENHAVLHRAAADLDALMGRVDVAASRFRTDSALRVANAQAGHPTFVPRLLCDLLGVALHAAYVTDGAVDPTVYAGLITAGYDRDIREVLGSLAAVPAESGSAHRAELSPAEVSPADQVPTPRTRLVRHDWRSVALNRDIGLLRMPADVGLDLGATTKAHVADLAAHDIATRYDTAVLVEIGGDIAVSGVRDGGWRVRVSETGAVDEDDELLALHRGGIATSTTTRRRWSQDGRTRHHIIDPATGEPAGGPWRTATVLGVSALEANTASTAAIGKGEAALDWLESRGYAARLVDRAGAVTHTATWPRRAVGRPVQPELIAS